MQKLSSTGYLSYMVGKWHCGVQAAHLPTSRGFNRFFGHTSRTDLTHCCSSL
jgi:arylsulfatase A-like enzyme